MLFVRTPHDGSYWAPELQYFASTNLSSSLRLATRYPTLSPQDGG